MAKSGLRMMAYALLLGALFLGYIALLGTMEGTVFTLEAMGLVVLLFLAFLSFMSYNSWGERVLLLVFVIYVGNLFLIWYFLNFLSFVLLVVALFAVGLSFLQFSPARPTPIKNVPVVPFPKAVPKAVPPGPYSEVFEESPQKTRSSQKVQKVSSQKAKTTFSPGKYVGSKFGATFHEPKSEWARKIKPGNQVWFQDKDEAEKKGYTAHLSLGE